MSDNPKSKDITVQIVAPISGPARFVALPPKKHSDLPISVTLQMYIHVWYRFF